MPTPTGWYNNEQQLYTASLDNSYVEGGALHIRALSQQVTLDGVTKAYTSARLNSKFAFQYGSVRVRARMPTQPGLWPAIWSLGQNIDEPGGYWQTQGYGRVPWPQCGEMDIMEHWTSNGPRVVSCALHLPESYGNTVYFEETELDAASEFHVYELRWTAQAIQFFVDDAQVFEHLAPSNKTPENWPFDAPQYLLLNVAVTDAASVVNDAMVVDYVRVYEPGGDLVWYDEF